MRTSLIFLQYGLDDGKVVFVVFVVKVVAADGCAIPLIKRAQPKVIAFDVAVFQRKDHIDVVLLYGVKYFLQALQSLLGGHGVLHFVKANVAQIAKNVVARASAAFWLYTGGAAVDKSCA